MSDRELPVTDLLAARRVVEPGADFWNELEARLATEPSPIDHSTTLAAADGVDTEVDGGNNDIDELQRRRVRRRLIVTAAAAAAAVAIIFGINSLTEDTGPTPFVTDINTPTTAATTTTTTATTETAQPAARDSYGLPLISVASDVASADFPDSDGRSFGAATNGVLAFSGSQFVLINDDGSTTSVDSPTSIPWAYVEAEDAIWVVWQQSSESTSLVLQRVDIETGERTDIGNYPNPAIMPGPFLHIDGDAIWVFYYDILTGAGGIGAEHIDARSGEVVAAFGLGADRAAFGREQFAVGAGSLWEANWDPSGSGLVRRYDPVTGELSAEIDISATDGQWNIVVRDDAVWVITGQAIFHLDPATNEILATIEPPDRAPGFHAGATAIASNSALFVQPQDEGPPALYRIDANANEIDAVIDLGASSPFPGQVVISADTLWFGSDALARVPLDSLQQPPDRDE